jgi:autotransporter-associated beta strand protein
LRRGHGGTIQTTPSVVNAQTVSAPLVLEGDYTFISGASSNSATLSFGGGITPGATSGLTTLTLNGSNAGDNTIGGVLSDNGLGKLAVTKSGTGVWILSGANTYSGNTSVLAGTLKFNINTGAPTVAAGTTATVASGATLELAGSVSALGSTAGNRTHVVNSSTAPGLIVSGTHQVVGGIDGIGNVQIDAGSDLTADHIIQSAMIIGGTSGSHGTVTIDASDGSGNPLGRPAASPNGLAIANSIAPSGLFETGVNSSGLNGDVTSDDSALASGSPSDGGSPTVPEPSTMFLGALALAGLLVRFISKKL